MFLRTATRLGVPTHPCALHFGIPAEELLRNMHPTTFSLPLDRPAMAVEVSGQDISTVTLYWGGH